MRSLIRWPLVAVLVAALALPVRPAAAAESGVTPTGVHTSGGVVLAMGCGFSAGLFSRTGSPLMLVLAVLSCGLMIVDALETPDR